jgi:hypothetical protein
MEETSGGSWPAARDGRTQIGLHPAVRFRFSDVLDELRAIADMAMDGVIDPAAVEASCRRAESLLRLLRRQFLEDVVISDDAPSARASV